MKAQELRIGNLVWDTISHEIDTIDAIEESRIGLTNSIPYPYMSLDEITGIELTEEWLLKTEFWGVNYWWSLDKLTLGYITKDNCFQFEWLGGVIDIKYVHQLQNLYWCL